MAIGKNLKKGSKDEPSKKKDVPAKKKPLEDQTVIETPKDEIQTSSKEETKDTTQSLNQLNYDLDTVQQVEENSRMLVVFPVGKEEYAFEIGQIKEVVPVPPISPVPQTKVYILGVANVRGNVLAVVDLARKFGLKKEHETDHIKYVIVIKSEDVKVAVASSQVPETLMIKESQIDSTADVMRKTNSEQSFINGVVKKDNRMIILIDVLEMVNKDQE
ncbi:purine-binding chemotaxis protein CheW [Reichenbachiella faecimaris]|uniref:Purine-binding chemotaxis protein CheW n=1 Tax=Reichenbachiella faecimaris TaxID=692418 RepID=A0A1W2G9E5_REIFA|nr:chemotaxis protein CheW [Reichenbachiella faecimaris]SMD32926.1 purine-binding chemotaxis protein CheW [Reichenbachiella faecimaris]